MTQHALWASSEQGRTQRPGPKTAVYEAPRPSSYFVSTLNALPHAFLSKPRVCPDLSRQPGRRVAGLYANIQGMSDPQAGPVTALLHAWQQGDGNAFSRLIEQVHAQLRRMAAARLHGAETPSLAADDLLNESLLKLMAAPPQWENRAHFFATMSLVMRSVLVDHARARLADRRGGAWARLTYTLSEAGEESCIADLLTLDSLLKTLQAMDPRAAQVLDLTYFGGLKRDDIATVMALSVPTIDRELRFARAWLSAQLQRELEA